MGDEDRDILEEPETSEEDELDTGTEADEESETGEADESDKSLKEDAEDKEPDPIPYARFKEVNDKAKRADEIETKFDQFKRLGPDAYYKLYPDEKPDGYGHQEEKTEIPKDDPYSIQVEGGKWDGMTFRQVFEQDRDAAWKIAKQAGEERLYFGLERKAEYDEAQQRQQAQTEQQRLKDQADKEVSEFQEDRATELFGKGFAELSKEEQTAIGKIINETLDWSEQTGRSLGNLKDAYILKNLDKIVSGEKSKISEGLFKTLTKSGAASISANKGGGEKNSYGAFVNMDANQVAKEMYHMTDAEQAKFLKDAPKTFRDKFPSLPYPDER